MQAQCREFFVLSFSFLNETCSIEIVSFISIKTRLPLKALRYLLEVTKLSNENVFQLRKECVAEIERLEWHHLERTNNSVNSIAFLHRVL